MKNNNSPSRNKTAFALFCLVFICLFSCADKYENKIGKSIIDPHYLDPYRPQIHYSRDTGWLSDPNGLFYLDGKWHLMFQGFSNKAGKYKGTNWDHAESADLLHWQHLPTVLKGGNEVSYYSGSAVVDLKNVSNLGSEKEPPVVAFYTTHFMGGHATPNRNNIAIAYSKDKGITWINSEKIVIQNDEFPSERDPSVFYHEESEKWIMATAGTGNIRFYSSKNLLDWTFESESLPYPSWECPDLSYMTVEETGEKKVLLITSTNGGVPNSSHGTSYHIGTFDGTNFIPEDSTDTKYWLDWGSDFYAGITYSNSPDRNLFQSWFGWPSQWNQAIARTTKFSGSMNLIRELKLHKDEKGTFFLTSNPIEEYKKLRRDSSLQTNLKIKERVNIRKNIGSHEPLEILIDAEIEPGSIFGIRLKNDFGEDYVFKYDDWHKQFTGDRTNAGTVPGHYTKSYNQISKMPYEANLNALNLRIYWDVSTFEVFVDEGKDAFSQLFYPREPFNTLELFTFSGETQVKT